MTKLLIPLSHWRLANPNHPDLELGMTRREIAAARKNWCGRTFVNVSLMEMRTIRAFVAECTREDAYATRAVMSGDRVKCEELDGSPIWYDSFEIGVWFKTEADDAALLSEIASLPQRTVEILLDREPEPEEARILKGLNYMLIPVTHDPRGKLWFLSTEYDPRVIEFRLKMS